MADLNIQIQAELDKALSRTNIINDIHDLEKTPFTVAMIARLNKALSQQNIERDIRVLEQSVSNLRLNGRLNRGTTNQNIQNDLRHIGNNTDIAVSAHIDNNELNRSLIDAVNDIERDMRNDPVIIPVVTDTGNIGNTTNQLNSLTERIQSNQNIFADYLTADRAIDAFRDAVKNAVESVEELNKAETDLQIATGKSSEEVKSLMRDYNDLAKSMSSTTTDITSAADDWLRQGNSVADTNILIRDSIIMSKIGQIESAEATQYLTSAMKGYKIQAEDVIDIVDKLSAVDLKSASNSGELAEAMSDCANVARTAGVELDTLVAYLAVTKDVTQDSASSIGNAFKSIFTRLQNIKIGKFLDEEGNDIKDAINDAEKVLSKFNISLRDNAKEFRNAEDVIADVAEQWDNMSSVEQAAIKKAFGNTYQAEKVTALFENYDKVLELTAVSADSAGTAMDKFSAYENSLEAATNRLTASLEGLAYNTVDSGFLTGLANAGADIVEFVDKTNLLKTGLTAGMFTAAISGITALGRGLVDVGSNITRFTQAMELSRQATALTNDQYQILKNSVTGLNQNQINLIVTSQHLNEAQRIELLQLTGLNEAEARARLQTLGLTTAEEAQTAATFSLRGAWEALKISIATNPIGLIVTALTLAVSAISEYNRKQEEARQNAVDSAKSLKEYSDKLHDLTDEYKNIVDSEKKEAEKTEELNEWKQTLAETYGFERKQLEELNLERENGIDLLEQEINIRDKYARLKWERENQSQIKNAIGNLYYTDDFQQSIKEYYSDYYDNVSDDIKKVLSQNNKRVTNVFEEYEQIKELYIALTDSVKRAEMSGFDMSSDIFTESGKQLLADKELLEEVTKEINILEDQIDKYGDIYRQHFENEAFSFFEAYKENNPDDFDLFSEEGRKAYISWREGLIDESKNTDYGTEIQSGIKEILQADYKEYEKYYADIENLKKKVSVSDLSVAEFANINKWIDSLDESDIDILANKIQEPFKNGLFGAKKLLEDFKNDPENTISFNIAEYSEQVDGVIKNTKTLKSAIDEINKSGRLEADTIQNLANAFPAFSKEIISAQNDSEQLKDVLTRAMTAESSSLIITLRSLEDLSEDDRKAVNSLIIMLENLGKTTVSYADIIKDLENKESLLDSIHKELHDDGHISISTYNKLIEAGSDYADLVSVENGQLKISEQAYKDLIIQKYKDQIATLELAKAEDIRKLSVMGSIGATADELDIIRQDITAKEQAIQGIYSTIDLLGNYTPKENNSGSSSAKSQYSNDLQLLKDQLNDRVITYEQFLQRWQALNDKYHNMSEEDGGISDYEWGQNNREIIAERTKAYEEEKKALQELYEAGKISLDEYNKRVNASLKKWLGGYTQLSSDFEDAQKDNIDDYVKYSKQEYDKAMEALKKSYENGEITLDQFSSTAQEYAQKWLGGLDELSEDFQDAVDENYEYVKSHFFDKLDRDIDELDEKYKNTGKEEDLDAKEARLLSDEDGLGYINKRLADLDAAGVSHDSKEYQDLLTKQKQLNQELQEIYDERVDIVTNSLDKELSAYDEEYKNTSNNSIFGKKIDSIYSANEKLEKLANWYEANGYIKKANEIREQIADNNKKVLDVNESAYEADIKSLKEAYSRGEITIDEFKNRAEESASRYLGHLDKNSDTYKDYVDDAADYVKEHYFDVIDRESEEALDNFDKTKDVAYLDTAQTKVEEGYKKATDKLAELDANGVFHDSEEYQYWLGEQQRYNEQLEDIIDKRVDIINSGVDEQIEAIDREVKETGDYSKIYDKIGIYEQGKSDINEQIQELLDNGYSMDSEKIKELLKQVQEYDDNIYAVYTELADRIDTETQEQLDNIDREIKRTGDAKQYQIKLNVLADSKKSLKDLKDTLIKAGVNANSEIIKDLDNRIQALDDDIADTSRERADAQADAYAEVMGLETERLEKYKKEQDEIFDAKIKALEDQKKKLEEQNKEIERQNELQEKQKAILDAQRGVIKSLRMVYSGNGQWTVKPTDESMEALKEAENDLDETLRKQQVEAIDDLIDALKDQKSTFDDAIDKQITAIEEGVAAFEKAMTDSYKVYSKLDYELIKSIVGEDAANEYQKNFDEYYEKNVTNKETTEDNTTATENNTAATEEQTEATNEQTKSTATLTGFLDRAGEAAEKFVNKLENIAYDNFSKQMQDEYGLGNVDLTKRPFVSGEKMRQAGYDVDKNGISTVFSGTEFLWQGDEEHGKYVAVHYTPILPNGEVLTEQEMTKYLKEVLEGSESILDADTKGLVLKVDTDFDISEEDIKSLESGNLTQHMKDILDTTDEWDIKLHNVQETWMELWKLNFGEPNVVKADDSTNTSSIEKTDNGTGILGTEDKKALYDTIDLFGSTEFKGFLGTVQKIASGELSVGILPTSIEALNKIANGANIVDQQTINNVSNFTPNINNNFTINAPANSAEDIKNAVTGVIDDKIVQSFRAFYDGYYQQSMKEMYGNNK